MSESDVIGRFGRFASSYVTSPSHAKGPDLACLIELARLEASWRVLDVATGGGHTALAVAPHVKAVVALDLTPKMLEAAQAHVEEAGAANVEFVVGDAAALPFRDGEFDCVTCRIAAHHFPSVEVFAQEAARVLASGGRLVVQDLCVPEDADAAAAVNAFEKDRDPSHVRALAESEWCEVLEAAGFVVDSRKWFPKRMVLSEWAGRQGWSQGDISRMGEALDATSGLVRAWMEPAEERGERSFTIRHLVLGATSVGH